MVTDLLKKQVSRLAEFYFNYWMCAHPGFSRFTTFSLSSSAVWLGGGLWLVHSVSMFLKLIPLTFHLLFKSHRYT